MRWFADVPHQLRAGSYLVRSDMIRNRHPPLAHSIGQKHVALIRTFFAIRHEITTEGVHIDEAIFRVRERVFAWSKLLFVDREPPCIGVDGLAGGGQEQLE